MKFFGGLLVAAIARNGIKGVSVAPPGPVSQAIRFFAGSPFDMVIV